MVSLCKNQYCEINLDADANYAEIIYFETTANMSTDEYKAETIKMTAYYDQFFKSSVNKIFIDARLNFYPIVPELQLWTIQQFDRFKTHAYNTAIVQSSDIIANLSMDQVVSELYFSEYEPIVNKLFDDVESAKKWLFRSK